MAVESNGAPAYTEAETLNNHGNISFGPILVSDTQQQQPTYSAPVRATKTLYAPQPVATYQAPATTTIRRLNSSGTLNVMNSADSGDNKINRLVGTAGSTQNFGLILMML